MSNLNDFTNPQLKVIKSKNITVVGMNNSGPSSITLDASTKLLRIYSVIDQDRVNYRLTLDGTDPSQTNVDNLIEFFQTYLSHDSGNISSVADTLIFETKVSGGETLKLVYAGAQDTWEDASGTKKLLIQQLSY